MPKLKLMSLACNAPQDWDGTDETYIRIAGKRVWGPEKMKAMRVEDLEKQLPAYRFQNKIRIDLYERDTHWLKKDDHLGRTYARADMVGGEWEHQFRGFGANYLLTFKVILQ